MNLSSLLRGQNEPQPTDPSFALIQPEYPIDLVNYLPVGLTSFQRDLVEILIGLHKNSLLKQLQNQDDSLQSIIPDYHYLSDEELQQLLVRNINLVLNHPYLLVEHYMPKKLLLMESHERLMFASDKFRNLDKLLNAVKDLSIEIVIVGHNVKELDLIEAFILGRDLIYKRYSGAKLVEDAKPVRIEEKKVKDDDYVPKKKPDIFPKKLNLHLITTQQLYGTFLPPVNFILSFDETLNEKDSYIEYLRSLKGDIIPLIKVVVTNSQRHGQLKEIDFKNSLYSSIVHRDDDINYDNELGIIYEKVAFFFKDPRVNRWPVDLPAFKTHTREEIINSINKIDLEFQIINVNKRVKLEEVIIPDTLTIKDYNNLLTKLTLERISKIESSIDKIHQDLRPLRIRSNLKHLNDDQLKNKIAELFKKSQTLKEDSVNAEKRFERLESEHDKYVEILKTLKDKKEVLSKIKSGEITKSEEDLTNELNNKESELKSLKQHIDTLETELPALRSTYQSITSKAAELSTLSKFLETTNKELLSKIEGQGLKLRRLKDEEIKLSNEIMIDKLKNQLEFLHYYNDKINVAVKEKISTLSVGRNGRVHRSTTPYS